MCTTRFGTKCRRESLRAASDSRIERNFVKNIQDSSLITDDSTRRNPSTRISMRTSFDEKIPALI